MHATSLKAISVSNTSEQENYSLNSHQNRRKTSSEKRCYIFLNVTAGMEAHLFKATRTIINHQKNTVVREKAAARGPKRIKNSLALLESPLYSSHP